VVLSPALLASVWGGVGLAVAGVVLLSVIGDIEDFAHPGKLAAYFGIVPRVRNSNETEHSGRITKRGTKLGRTTLVQCALIAMRYSPYLALRKNRTPTVTSATPIMIVAPNSPRLRAKARMSPRISVSFISKAWRLMAWNSSRIAGLAVVRF